eukprot:1478621-Alexandrium_andersonii.AAC.1
MARFRVGLALLTGGAVTKVDSETASTANEAPDAVLPLAQRAPAMHPPTTHPLRPEVEMEQVSSNGAVSYTHLTLPTICSV